MKLLGSLNSLDLWMLLWWLKHRQKRFIATASLWVSHSGDGYVQVILLGAMLSANDPSIKLAGILGIILFATERLLYWVLKNTLRRPRPAASVPTFSALVKASDEFSFPSGHTSAAVLIAAISLQLNPVLGGFLMVWATLVGLSRVIVGVHYPTDIVAGISLGLGIYSLHPLISELLTLFQTLI